MNKEIFEKKQEIFGKTQYFSNFIQPTVSKMVFVGLVVFWVLCLFGFFPGEIR